VDTHQAWPPALTWWRVTTPSPRPAQGVLGTDSDERVDEADNGALVFFGEQGDHLKPLPQAAGFGIYITHAKERRTTPMRVDVEPKPDKP
jgi:hypothetical protein